MSADRARKDPSVLRERAEFAQRLKQYMHVQGWNSTALDRASGVGKKTIDRLLKQQTSPQPTTIKRLAAAFAVSPEELLGRQTPPALGPAAGADQVNELRTLAVQAHVKLDAITKALGVDAKTLAAALAAIAGQPGNDASPPRAPAQSTAGRRTRRSAS